MFWTLDLDGTRYMVKPLIGAGGGGMRYLYWAGPGKDFEEKPLALSFLSSPQPNSISSTVREGPSLHPINRKRRILTDDYETSDSDSSIETSESDLEGNATRPRSLTQHGVDAGPGIPSRQMDDCGSRAMGYANALTQPTVPHSNPAKKRTTEISGPLVGRRSGEHRPGPTQPTREETIKQKYKTRIENQLDREFDQIFTPWAGDDQDVGRDTLLLILKVIDIMKDSSPQNIARTLNRALNGGTGKREDTGGRRPTGIWFKSLKADLEDAKTTSNNGGTTNIHSLSSANPQPRNHIKLRRTEVESGQGSSSDPQSTPFDGNRQQLDPDQNLDISPPTILSQHKQNLTTLIVRVAPFVKYQPVELSECMALKSFYAEVLGAWGIRGESVAEITVTFTWKDPEDPMRMMVMNSKNKACFAHLIKQVDHAPGWEEGDEEHLVDVEIVLKE